MSTDADIVERLRKHVNDRGGASIDNGAWQMMLDAADMLAVLTDPTAVHLNMLRGGIAKPSWANIQHLYPEEFAKLRAERDAAARDMRERCAKVAETFPEMILQMWDRPGGPPGNGYRASHKGDIATAIRALPSTVIATEGDSHG